MIDYHVHLWPHDERADEGDLVLGRVAEYTDAAACHGVREIALTEHLFRFVQGRAIVDRWWETVEGPSARHLEASVEAYFDHHATADLDRYVETALAAKAAGLPVKIGLEVDYYPGRMGEVAHLLSGYPFDVLLGSVHWLGNWMFDDLADAETSAQLEQVLVLVGSVHEEGCTRPAASKDIDVVVHRAYDGAVELARGVFPDALYVRHLRQA